MLITRNWLQSHFETELPSVEKIAETLMLHSFELEGIEYLSDNAVIDIDVLPNRAHDCLSYAGVAREYAVLTGYELKSERYHYHDSVIHTDDSIIVSLDNVDQCYRYMARPMGNVTVTDSPKWLQERLESIGQKTINNIVDATNFVMFDTGNPMHVFDADKVTGAIVVRNAVAGEVMVTLSGEELVLEETDLVIADEEGVLALAGVKGGTRAEVDAHTKNIIIEVANFNPTTTRTTARRVKILTDSSKRFENGISSEVAPVAMEAISRLLTDLMEGESLGQITDVYPHQESVRTVIVSRDHINRLLGVDFSSREIEEILSKIDYQFHTQGTSYEVVVPANRLDLNIPEDIIEEIGRIYGYHNIPVKSLDEYSFTPQVHSFSYLENLLKNFLVQRGFSELKNYTFVKKGDIEMFNPIASDKKALRKNLSKQMIEALEKNIPALDYLGQDQVLIFEIGQVYTKLGEKEFCTIAIANKDKKSNKKHGSEQSQLESLAVEIIALLGVNIDVEYEKNTLSFEIPQEVSVDTYADIFTEKTYNEDARFHTVSAFPYITRDISFWAPESIAETILVELISTLDLDFLKKTFVFDRFEKDGRVSYGFSLIFQSNEKTLTDVEVAQEMRVIEEKLIENSCEIR